MITGRIDGVQQIELRPLGLGARFLLTDTWAVFTHFGVGWYTQFFTVDRIQGLSSPDQSGDFSRQGWNWLVDVGVRYHLNDTLFVEGSIGLGDDFTYDDIDLTTVVTAGFGVTWEDFLGINRIGRGDDSAGSPPSELDDAQGGVW